MVCHRWFYCLLEQNCSHRSQQFIINGCLSGDVKVATFVPQPVLEHFFPCYMLALEDKLKELVINYHFYADDTDLYLVFGLTLSKCMFDDILTSIQSWFSNRKLKLNAENIEYKTFWEKMSNMIFYVCQKVQNSLNRKSSRLLS